jgi:hypothetical protein
VVAIDNHRGVLGEVRGLLDRTESDLESFPVPKASELIATRFSTKPAHLFGCVQRRGEVTGDEFEWLYVLTGKRTRPRVGK